MTLEQLRVFAAVADLLHVTRAAASLNITQSAASAAIQALESRLGMPLFDRIGRRIELTEAGRTFLPEAKAVLRSAAQAEDVLAELAGLQRGHLRLSASQTIAGYWLPARMHRFAEVHPRISLHLDIGNTAQVTRAVLAGETDLGFVEGDIDEPLLARIPVARDRLALVVGAGHPWAGRTFDLRRDIAELRWVLRESGSGTRQTFEDAMRAAGLNPKGLDVALELPSNEAVCCAVEAGAGATVVSRLVVAAPLAAGRLVELPLPLLERQFVALRHGDRHRSRLIGAFLDLARDAERPGPAGA